jgi:hypothetical protein
MGMIIKFREVQAIDRQINKSTKGAHGVSIMARDEFNGNSAYYDFRVGDNSNDLIYYNIFDFILEKKTEEIKVYDTASDSIISLKDWRKIRR